MTAYLQVKMNRNYFYTVLVLAASCLALIIITMWHDDPSDEATEQFVSHPPPPYKSYIYGAGVVEPSSENILIGAPVNRIVDRVLATVGQRVKKGEVLILLEDRDLQADLGSRQVIYENAMAKLQKLEALPRKEDVAFAEAALSVAQAELSNSKDQYEMVMALKDPRAVSQQEINRRRANFEQAHAKTQQANAELEKLKAGTWRPDLDIAGLEVLEAKANIYRVLADIERTTIRSPIDGTVLQIKIHKGEMPSPDTVNAPMMIVGNTDELHLRVSINQFDSSYFEPESPAIAFLQRGRSAEFPLEFVKMAPLLVNKMNASNSISEKMDTRVLQVIYRFKQHDPRLFVGQQMDAFIEANDLPRADR